MNTSNFKTFFKITEADEYIIGRGRKMNEWRTGHIFEKLDDDSVIDYLRVIKSETTKFSLQEISDDFKTITIYDYVNWEACENNLLHDYPIKAVVNTHLVDSPSINLSFDHPTKTRKIKVKSMGNGQSIKTVPSKCTHEAIAATYKVVDATPEKVVLQIF